VRGFPMPFKKIFKRFLNLPLRAKFILSFLAVICFGGIVTITLGTRLEHQTIIGLAQAKVRHDLASARMVYDEKLNHIRDFIRFNSTRDAIQEATKNQDRVALSRYLGRARTEFNLDILTLTDSRGKVILRAARPENWGDDLSANPLVAKALSGEIIAGTQIIPREELLKEGEGLADRAYLEFIPTPKAVPREEDHEEDGMMLKAAAPIRDGYGTIIGVIYGGILLNQNYEIVDRVKEIVYKGEKYKGREIGTATIFQKDLRISTNVKDASGERAIGTRISREVHQAVLIQGEPWIDRAFVVNDWYITAYEPIHNIGGNIIGILYVGMLEKPYIDLRNRVMLTFAGMAALSVVLLLTILFFITSSIIHPLKSMVFATNQIAQGELNQKVNIDFKDEIGQLAHSFNQMAENLKKANEKLIQWGTTLEKRVEERTKELQEMQDSLIQSEKMASLGKMSAGVAHEINNPLTSILINTHLMLEKTEKTHLFHEYLSLIADETIRCTNIVKGLLEFSRQNPPQKSYADINEIIKQTLQLLEHQAAFHNIRVARKLGESLPQIKVDKDKIKQVFWNLMINAAEAMPKGGILTIASRLSEDENFVEVIFTDTGVGIPAEYLNKLFDPFFTTKGSGTGLGLAVSYGIIEQHQGKIEVRSEPGRGSVFTVRLPRKD